MPTMPSHHAVRSLSISGASTLCQHITQFHRVMNSVLRHRARSGLTLMCVLGTGVCANYVISLVACYYRRNTVKKTPWPVATYMGYDYDFWRRKLARHIFLRTNECNLGTPGQNQLFTMASKMAAKHNFRCTSASF